MCSNALLVHRAYHTVRAKLHGLRVVANQKFNLSFFSLVELNFILIVVIPVSTRL